MSKGQETKPGWTKSGTDFYLGSGDRCDVLPGGVYKLLYNAHTHQLYLSRVQNGFELPAKVYELDEDLIRHAVGYYQKTGKNTGVLLVGAKGSGKTITSKLICGRLGLPVILVCNYQPGIASFINDIVQDIVVFVDEYEKIFDKHTSDLLSVMDGALDNGFSRVYLFTANYLGAVSNNLLERPGRIRYVKRYGDLNMETVQTILNDRLHDIKFFAKTLAYIKSLNVITIDVCMSIVDEVNLFNEPPQAFSNIFNVKLYTPTWTVHLLEEGKEPVQIASIVTANHVPVKGNAKTMKGGVTIWHGKYKGYKYGVVKEFISKSTVRMHIPNDSAFGDYVYQYEQEDRKERDFHSYQCEERSSASHVAAWDDQNFNNEDENDDPPSQ